MSHILCCEIAAGALPHLKALRLRHLEYIREHRDEILFGGPARSSGGMPETMFIVLETDDGVAAQAFIDAEPYNASGRVFSRTTVRRWSQVVPDPNEGGLDHAIDEERAAAQRSAPR